MATRIFLCNREHWYHGVEDEIKEAKQSLSIGKIHLGTWTCGQVQSIEVNDAAYFRRVNSEPLGFFAYGRIVAADKEYQLRLIEPQYSHVSEAYEACYDDEGNVILAVAYEWHSVVNYNQPLKISQLQQDPQFAGANFNFQGSGQRFREDYIDQLNRYWQKHVLSLSKKGAGVHLAEVLYKAGQEKANQKLYSEAIEQYNRAVCIDPIYTSAYIGRGNVYQMLGKPRDAIQNYTEVLRINATNNATNFTSSAVAYYKRGLTLADLGNKQEAVEDLVKAEVLFLNATDSANSEKVQEKIRVLTSSKTPEVEELAAIRARAIIKPANSSQEARKRVLTTIFKRQGQSLFRQQLLEAYNNRCAITTCDVEEALEAAHIIPYSAQGSNHVTNGLLLRADLHTLFDLNLIAIKPETFEIFLHPSLRQSSYLDLHSKSLRLPSVEEYRPNREALEERWEQCNWASNT